MGKQKFLGKCILFLILTVLTQIGGFIYLVVLALAKISDWRSKLITSIVFTAVYASANFATTYIAPLFGRHAISCSLSQITSLKIANPIFCALNRQHVNKDLLVLLEKASSAVNAKYAGTQTLVLDANFPFFDGFPLLPHLSHDDGRKVDLAFYYKDDKGYLSDTMRSPIGYWGFSQPIEFAELPCSNFQSALTLRWDMEFLQGFWGGYEIEPQRTKFLLNWLVGEGRKYGLDKILLEPHLKSQLGVASELMRFQGCRAARHDDHIHLQVGVEQ